MICSKNKEECRKKQMLDIYEKWGMEEAKKHKLKDLPKEEIMFLSIIYYSMSISSFDQEKIQKSREYLETKNLLINIIELGENSSKIDKIYKTNINKEIKILENEINNYKLENLPKDKKNQIDNLKMNNNRESIIKKLIDEYYNNKDDAVLIKKEKELTWFESLASGLSMNVLTSSNLESNKHILEKISCFICHPEKSDLLVDIEDKYRWRLSHWSISDIKELDSTSLSTNEREKLFLDHYLDELEKKILYKNCLICNRKNFILEIISTIKSKYYKVAITSLYAIIEGLLWDFAYLVDKVDATNEVFISKKDNLIYDLDNKKEITTTRIRDILEKTVVREYITLDFISYFCKELYENRNPTMHGKNYFNNISKKDIIDKLATLNYIIEIYISLYEESLKKEFNNTFKGDRKKEIIQPFIKLWK